MGEGYDLSNLDPSLCWGWASINHRTRVREAAGPSSHHPGAQNSTGSHPHLPVAPGRRGSGQEVNKEDGQANVKQDHHADEDGVGDLGAVERGCLSPHNL